MIVDGQLFEIKKVYDLDKANYMVVNEGTEMEGYISVWDFLGCSSETDENGVVRPFYVLGLRLYNRPDYIDNQDNNTPKFDPRKK